MSLQHDLCYDNCDSAPQLPPEPAPAAPIVNTPTDAPRVEDRLSARHLADLRASGLTDEAILRAELRTSTDPEKIAAKLNWTFPGGVQQAADLGDCLAFPFFATDGTYDGFARFKPDRPRDRKNSKGGPSVIKYESPIGSTNRAYFPPGTRSALSDATIPILITEGEKKSLAADQLGFACIGLIGVDGWSLKRDKKNGKPIGQRKLIRDMAAVEWKDRPAFVAYDSDIVSKPDVQRAEKALAAVLTKHGANVRLVRLPPKADGSKVGLDDYLKDHTPADLQALLDSATPTGRPNDGQPTTGAAIILAHFRDHYQPDFRRGNSIHTAAGDLVPMSVACATPTSAVIEKLANAEDAPCFANGGGLNRNALPSFFSSWARVAWGDLLVSLPDEDAAPLTGSSTAAEEFRRLVREAMLSEIVLGDTIKGSDVTQTRRASLIDWCETFAKPGPWKSIRSKRCWCKCVSPTEGEVVLKVAIRVELFGQLRADRRLCAMTLNTFTRLAERYGVGTSTRKDRPEGLAAVVLAQEFVDDLTSGLPDANEAGYEALGR